MALQRPAQSPAIWTAGSRSVSWPREEHVEDYERYEEVYSVSDLHLTAGDRVDEAATSALKTLVERLTERASELGPYQAALVVNGDSVDFLDVPPWRHFDPLGAPAK